MQEDVTEVFKEAEEAKRANAAKDRELARLKSELEAMQLTVDDESYDQQTPKKRSYEQGSGRQPVVSSGHQWPSVAISGHQWSSECMYCTR